MRPIKLQEGAKGERAKAHDPADLFLYSPGGHHGIRLLPHSYLLCSEGKFFFLHVSPAVPTPLGVLFAWKTLPPNTAPLALCIFPESAHFLQEASVPEVTPALSSRLSQTAVPRSDSSFLLP